MAGGCTESPRLWLNSSLPNPNGWVGRGYTDHAFDWIFGVFDEYTGSSKGTGSSARVDFHPFVSEATLATSIDKSVTKAVISRGL